MTGKFYITTAIDYVNGKPHIGHAYEKICADSLARWHRMTGDDTFFLTGTDENGQKNEKAAKEAGMDTKTFVDNNSNEFKKLCSVLNISYDDFIRTTEERHSKTAKYVFTKLSERGLLYKSLYKGLYCEGCEGFLTEKDLVDGKCPEHNKEPKYMEEEAYFFKLSEFKDRLIALINNNDLIFPESRKNEILSRLMKDELKDLCVSRKNINWGIVNPIDSDYMIYVWIDALTNYISALDYPGGKFEKYWPADVHMIGKGINWFHSVIWPAILMGCEIKTPEKIVVHGYVTSGGHKIGKSLGNAIDPVALAEKYSSDFLRYFLIREIPFGEDGDFSEDALKERINNELGSNYGNLFYRVTSFIEKNFETVPEPGKSGESERKLEEKIKSSVSNVGALMEKFRITDALKEIMELSSEANRYFQEKEPWKTVKTDKEDCKTTIYYSVNALKTISILLYPFVPRISEKAIKLLDLELITKEIKPYILNPCVNVEKKLFDASQVWECAGNLSVKPGSKVFSEILVKKIE